MVDANPLPLGYSAHGLTTEPPTHDSVLSNQLASAKQVNHFGRQIAAIDLKRAFEAFLQTFLNLIILNK